MSSVPYRFIVRTGTLKNSGTRAQVHLRITIIIIMSSFCCLSRFFFICTEQKKIGHQLICKVIQILMDFQVVPVEQSVFEDLTLVNYII